MCIRDRHLSVMSLGFVEPLGFSNCVPLQMPAYNARETLLRKPNSLGFVLLAQYLHLVPNQQLQRSEGSQICAECRSIIY